MVIAFVNTLGKLKVGVYQVEEVIKQVWFVFQVHLPHGDSVERGY